MARALDQGHPDAHSESMRGFADPGTDEGGGGGQKFEHQKWPDRILPILNFRFFPLWSLGRGGRGGSILMWLSAIPTHPCSLINGVPTPGGGGGDMQILHMGVLAKFFSPLEKRGSLGGFCTFQTCPLKKGTVFVLNKNQGKKAPRDPHWNL